MFTTPPAPPANALRHAVFKGLREVELTRPTPGRARLISDADLASVTITNPKRRLFGRSGATKLDVAVYYAAIGDFMLPHLLGRPVSLVRCPTGKPEDCFFQRHAFTGMPASVATFPSRNSEGETKTYLAIEDARGYLALAQFGVVEFHTWGARRAAAGEAGPRRLRPRPRRGGRLARDRRGGVHVSGRARGVASCPS
jgi:bifunctional non-homologous end joining protein LigD